MKAADVELDGDEAGLGPVEEEVDVEVVAVDFEVVLAPDEGDAVAELEEEVQRTRRRGHSSSPGKGITT